MCVNVHRLCCCLLVGLLTISLVAQTPPQKRTAPQPDTGVQKQPENSDSVLENNQRLALNLLKDLSANAKEITNERVRIKLQAQIADALWRWDEAGARQLFDKAFNAIKALQDEKRPSGREKVLVEVSQKLQLATEILRLISTHDSAWAQKLLSSMEQDQFKEELDASTREPLQASNNDNLAALYLRLAYSLVNTDLQRAIAITRQSLSYGINPSLAGVLDLIRRKDARAADDICFSALSTVRTDSTGSLTFVNFLGPYVLSGFGQSGPGANASNSAPQGPAVNQPLATSFLNLAYSISSQQSSPFLSSLPFEQLVLNYMTVRALVPYFDLYLPDKAGMIRFEATRRSNIIGGDDVGALDVFTESTNVDDLLEQANAAHNRDLKDSLFAKAALLASSRGDTEKAYSATEKISDPDLQEGLNTVIGFRAANKAIQAGDFEGARRFAQKISGMVYRVYILAQIANAMFKRNNDIPRATETLVEAKKLAEGKQASDADRVRAALLIATAMTRIDATLGVEYIRFAIKTMNDSSFDVEAPSHAAKGLQFVDLVDINLGVNRLDIAEGFSLLPRNDYQQAVYLARSIKNKEASALAQLAIAKSILAMKPKPADKPKSADASAAKPTPEGKKNTGAENRLKEIARTFVTEVGKENFYGAVAYFDDTMRSAMPAEKLREVWVSLLDQEGPFKKQTDIQVGKVKRYDVVVVKCDFESASLNVRIIFNEESQIIGLFFVPIAP